MQRTAQADGAPETLALLDRLLALRDVAALTERPPPTGAQAPVLPMPFRQGDISLGMFMTIATLGTPRNVTLQEVRIECFFPTDNTTAHLFCILAGST